MNKKNILKIAVIIQITLLFFSCAALDYTIATSTSNYTSRTYSSLYVDTIPNNATVIVECPMVDFQLKRVTELSIVSRLKEYGIQAFAMSDYKNIYEAENKEGEFTYSIVVTYDDMYTYEHGGGLSRMDFDCTVTDRKNYYTEVAKISGGVASKENKFLSFVETAEPACKLVGEEIADEYISFTKR